MEQLTDHTGLRKKLLDVNEQDFEKFAIDIFHFQYQQNAVYRQYCDAIRTNVDLVQTLHQIPFLPIQFFKSMTIKSTEFEPAAVFESSGTTGSINSKHHVRDITLYEESFLKAFRSFYGEVKNYCIIGLLPSYLERKNSSLVWMVNALIERSGNPQSGFYLYDHDKLAETLKKNEAIGQQTLLIGVTYALLDFFEQHPLSLTHTIMMETGGMKGRREELTRSEVHERLIKQAGVAAIHSEYGMTELLSQAYATSDGMFSCPPWMRILLRAEDDPFEIMDASGSENSANGVINIIDLANLYSCSFIATDDMGKLYPNGDFEVLGRLDNSDIRGCSLMLL